MAAGVTATGNAVVEETRARAVRRTAKSCIVEVGPKERDNKRSTVWWKGKCEWGRVGWDGCVVESEDEVLLCPRGNAQKCLPHLAGEARSLRY